MNQNKLSLRNFISREFFKAALLPLLVIEITLLALYFFMSTYLLDKSIHTLSNDRLSHLLGITESQTGIIREQLNGVSDLSLILQLETTRFFNHPQQFPSPSPAPRFGLAPNGVFYKMEDNGGCSLFYSARNPVGAAEKNKALRSEALDPLYRNLAGANKKIVAVYLNTFDSMSRYYPFHENVFEQLPAEMNIPEYNFYYLADKTHNPNGGPAWTAAYLDPMGMGWMMSCLVPIYRQQFLEGVAGIDITIKNFVDKLIELQLPWGAHAFLVDAEGTIMAMPPEVEHIFGLTELDEYRYKSQVEQDTRKPVTFNLLESVLSSVRKPVSELMLRESGSVEFFLDGHHYMLCQHTVSETGWKLMVIADRAVVLSPISQLERHTRHVGYAAIGFMMLFYILFFLYLVGNTRRMAGRIAAPVGELADAIHQLGNGVYETTLATGTVIELEMLSDSFRSMAHDLQRLHENLELEVKHANEAEATARQAEERLREHQVHLERIVEKRTVELREANENLRKDIYKRKQVEEELDRERRQLLSIFDSIDEPIYICSPDTYELLYVNEAFKKYWPDTVGGKCYEVLQHLEAPCPFCTNGVIFGDKTGQPYIWEFYNKTARRWFRCIDKAIQWPDGRMVRYEMAIDITEQKKAAEERLRLATRLQRAEKMEALGTLAGGVAHDLNNILSGIVSYPDLLLLDMPQSSPLRKPIETIKKSGQKAAATVQDLLTLARRGTAVMEVTNLNDIIAGYLASPEHERLAIGPEIRLETELSENLLNCKGSPVHLSKLVMNLVSNAAEAMVQGGDIFISTFNQYIDRPLKGYEEVREGDYVVLKIADTGMGIAAEDLERIFEPFYTKKKMGRSGTGLGMAVVWGTVKDHLGYIEVKSAVGSGTRIEIYLPATRDIPADAQTQSALEKLMGNNERILVVDDVALQREMAVEMLTRLGYDATAVSSGEAAVAYMEKNHADLVLLDMIMEPNIDGLETYKRIINIHPGQKAIIVSGFSETADIKEAQALGAGRYVKKPYTIQEIGLVLREELGKRKSTGIVETCQN